MTKIGCIKEAIEQISKKTVVPPIAVSFADVVVYCHKTQRLNIDGNGKSFYRVRNQLQEDYVQSLAVEVRRPLPESNGTPAPIMPAKTVQKVVEEEDVIFALIKAARQVIDRMGSKEKAKQLIDQL